MGKMKFSGPLRYRISSFFKINQIALGTYARRMFGREIEPTWGADIEIGVRFTRHQFTQAMTHPDIAKGRQIFDSLQLETHDVYDVQLEDCTDPKGCWHHPKTPKGAAVLLYLHGGGYTFHGAVSRRFASMLAHHTGLRVFAPDYRLTPEHPHPAQSEDAVAAWHYVATHMPADQIVVIGDSAGGHMALTLLQSLRTAGQPQPTLCVGLCPWTDIGDRGKSLFANDKYDLVQGWMALKFGEWLDPDGAFGRIALSPIDHDFAGLAPLYLQTGGREILRDMIREFAIVQNEKGAKIMLDQWDDMPHDFQAYDSLTASSSAALKAISTVIDAHLTGGKTEIPRAKTTVIRSKNF